MTEYNTENERFNVVQFFENGTCEYVRRNVSIDEATKATGHYCKSVAARMGMITRVIITDMLDCTCFEWTHKDGVVFPSKTELLEMGKKEEAH